MTCRQCGCDEENACEGGCFWVVDEVCSACWLRVLIDAASEAGAEAMRLTARQMANLAVLLASSIEEQEGRTANQPPLPRLWRPGDPIDAGIYGSA